MTKEIFPHVHAAFINAIREEGTKAEACDYLQRQWNETCALSAKRNAQKAEIDRWQENYKLVYAAEARAQNYIAKLEAERDAAPDPRCCLGQTAEDCATTPRRLCDGMLPDPRDEVITQLVADILKAAGEEYILEHLMETDCHRMGRQSTVRGVMVRLGLYPDLEKAIDAALVMAKAVMK